MRWGIFYIFVYFSFNFISYLIGSAAVNTSASIGLCLGFAAIVPIRSMV